MIQKKKKHGFLIALLFFVAVIDRITKISFIPFVGQGKVVLNDSIFSFIHIPFIFALSLTGALFLICLIWLMVSKKRSMVSFSLLFILFGIGSNLTDRIVYGGIVDWIRLPGISVFNIADVSIVTGVAFLFFDLFKKDV